MWARVLFAGSSEPGGIERDALRTCILRRSGVIRLLGKSDEALTDGAHSTHGSMAACVSFAFCAGRYGGIFEERQASIADCQSS